MGYMRHHAIVVTSWKEDLLRAARDKAVALHMSVTPVTAETTNGYRSFLVAPDGSKEGWDRSDRGDAARDELVEWLEAQCYEDGSTSLDWVEVQFGDDELHTRVVRDSDEQRRKYDRGELQQSDGTPSLVEDSSVELIMRSKSTGIFPGALN